MEILEEHLQSKAFREWSPTGKVPPHKETFGLGRSFIYMGKTYKNMIVDEKHYSPADLASAWSFDVETVRNIFRDEPGVLKLGDKNSKHKRGYTTLRIPESVAVRVHKRLSE
jgi:hypothetical protein